MIHSEQDAVLAIYEQKRIPYSGGSQHHTVDIPQLPIENLNSF